MRENRMTDYLNPHDVPPIPTVKLTSNGVRRDLSKSYLTPDDQHKTQHPPSPNTHDQGAKPSTKQPPPEDGLNDATQEAMPTHEDDPAEAKEVEDPTHGEPEQFDNASPDTRTPHPPLDEYV